MGRQAVADLDFEALEVAVRQQVLQLAGQAVEQRFNADLSDEVRGVRCSCGGAARYAGRRTKQVESVLGPLRLERAYYHCFRMRPRLLSSGSTSGHRKHLLIACAHAHGGNGRCHGQLPGG